jgi:mRNA deadenylase 3'-5' endonuclease subunit Ccr4
MADVFSPPEQFPRHAPDHLPWLYRGPRIVSEIAMVNPDLLCVQELGVDAEGAHFRPVMTSLGYEGLYKPSAWKEGCAIYWSRDKCVFFLWCWLVLTTHAWQD